MSDNIINIRRTHPLKDIDVVKLPKDVIINVDNITASVIYYSGSSSSILEKLVDDDGNKFFTIDEDESNFIFSINVNNAYYKNELYNKNFKVKFTHVLDPDVNFIAYYEIAPSYVKLKSVQLSNIKISETDAVREYHSNGFINSNNIAELWSDYKSPGFTSGIERIFYNQEQILITEGADETLKNLLDRARDNGGGKIIVEYGLSINKDENDNTIIIDQCGIQLSFIEQLITKSDNPITIKVLGVKESTLISGAIFNNAILDLDNSIVLFDNCNFSNCTFNLNVSSGCIFRNCTLSNCEFIGDNIDNENFIILNDCIILSTDTQTTKNIKSVNIYQSTIYGINIDDPNSLTDVKIHNTSFIPLYDVPASQFEYSLSNDGTYYSVKAGSKEISGNIIIPSTFRGLPVKEIENSGFNNCENITSIIIPDSITKINSLAFYGCSNLTSFILKSSSFIEASDDVFMYCTNLQNVLFTTDVYTENTLWNNKPLIKVNNFDQVNKIATDGKIELYECSVFCISKSGEEKHTIELVTPTLSINKLFNSSTLDNIEGSLISITDKTQISSNIDQEIYNGIHHIINSSFGKLAYTKTTNTNIVISNTTFIEKINFNKSANSSNSTEILSYCTKYFKVIEPYGFFDNQQFSYNINSIIVDSVNADYSGETKLLNPNGSFTGCYVLPGSVFNYNLQWFNYGTTGSYSYLTGAVKGIIYGVDKQGYSINQIKTIATELNTQYSDILELAFVETDIYSNPRSKTSPVIGPQEYIDTIVSQGNIKFNNAESLYYQNDFYAILVKYQTAIIENEKLKYYENELGQFISDYNLKYKTDNAVNDFNSNNVDANGTLKCGLRFNNTIKDLDNRQLEFIATCPYGNNKIISNGVKIKVADVPNFEYEEDVYNVYTGTTLFPAIITDAIDTNNIAEANWYKVISSYSNTKLGVTKFTRMDNNLYGGKAVYEFKSIEKIEAGEYFVNVLYAPTDFENARLFNAEPKTFKINVSYSVKIDKSLTTNGKLILRVNDVLSLFPVIKQGDNVWIEWQRTLDPSNDTSWKTVYGPVQNNDPYSIVLENTETNGYYYRLYAYNYVDPIASSGDIGSYDYSEPYVHVTTLPMQLTGDEMSSSLVLCKIPISNINDDDISIGDNYRIYKTAENFVDTQLVKTLSANPVIHRRPDEFLWTYNRETKKYVKSYEPYNFPNDLDIDKTNNKFAIASESLKYYGTANKTGGWLYLLDLENLNDLKDYKINKPHGSIDCVAAYEKSINSIPIKFESLGDEIFIRDNYIAVADPNASIVDKESISNYNKFESPELTINPDTNSASWLIDVTNFKYTDIPVIISTINNSVYGFKDITAQYNITRKLIEVNIQLLSYTTSILPAGCITITSIGQRDTINKNNLVNKHCTIFGVHAKNGNITWEIPLVDKYKFTKLPYFKLYSFENKKDISTYTEVKNASYKIIEVTYDGGLKVNALEVTWFDKKYEDFEDRLVTNGSYVVTFVDNNNEDVSDEVIIENIKSPALKPTDKVINWNVTLREDILDEPFFYLINPDKDIIIPTSYTYDKTNHKLTITINSDEMLYQNKYELIILEHVYKYPENIEALPTAIDHCGVVLLFKYNEYTGEIRYVRLIRSPNEMPFGNFGECIEFDDYGNILISAPNEKNEFEISYFKQDLTIVPVISGEDKLKFYNRGAIYIYDLNELINEDSIQSKIRPKQTLVNDSLKNSVNYNTGSWGLLTSYIFEQDLYVIKDKQTYGENVYEGFSTIDDYMEYYDFYYTYDFQFRKYFPTPYTEEDFKLGNSNSKYFDIEFRQLYFTSGNDDLYGSALSCNNNTLIIGSPYYKNNKGYIEVLKYNVVSKTYEYKSNLINPFSSSETLFGLNVEAGDGFGLVTYRSTLSRQKVLLLIYNSAGKITKYDIDIVPNNITKSKTFGNSLDSFGSSFVIGSPNEELIYRYNYNKDAEDSNIVSILQKIDLNKYNVSIGFDGRLVVVKDKLLAGYKTYGSLSKFKDFDVTYDDRNLVSVGSGAIVQLTLKDGEFRLE